METSPSVQWEYQTLAVKIEGGGAGYFGDAFRSRAAAIEASSSSLLQRLGLEGWELVSVLPVTTGKGTYAVRTEYAICFLRRARTRSVKAPIQGEPPKATAESGKHDLLLSAEEMKLWVRRQYVIDASKSGTLRLDDEMWDFLCENSVHEAVSTVIENVRACVFNLTEGAHKVLTQCQTYFGSLPPDYSKEHLYNLFLEPKTASFAFDAIVALNLFDFDKVNKLLLSLDFEHRKSALRLFNSGKNSYTQDDIASFQRCLVTIDTRRF